MACDKASVDQGNPWKLLALPKQNQITDLKGTFHRAAWEDGSVQAWEGRIGTQIAHPAAVKLLKLGISVILFLSHPHFLAFL